MYIVLKPWRKDGSFKRAINTTNPLGTKGDLAKAFATLVSMLWAESYTFLSPVTFRVSLPPGVKET